MDFRTQDKIGGALVFILSFPWFAYNLYTTFYKGYTRPGLFLLFLPMIIIGLALVFIPSSRTERFMRGESLSEGAPLYSVRWRVIMTISIIAGVASYFYFRFS